MRLNLWEVKALYKIGDLKQSLELVAKFSNDIIQKHQALNKIFDTNG